MLALSPEDLLLHLCCHAPYHHQFEFGLRPFCDIARTIGRFQDRIEWRVVELRSREFHWHRGVRLALRLAKELVGAAVPEPFLDADCDAAIVGTAVTQVLSDKAALPPISEGVARLYDQRTVAAGLRHLCRRIFLPREKLPATQLVPQSPWLVLAYLRRIRDLTAVYGWPFVRALFTRRATLIAMVERKNRLRNWLDDSGAAGS